MFHLEQFAYPIRRLADDFQLPYHGILNKITRCKCTGVEAGCILCYLVASVDNMVKV